MMEKQSLRKSSKIIQTKMTLKYQIGDPNFCHFTAAHSETCSPPFHQNAAIFTEISSFMFYFRSTFRHNSFADNRDFFASICPNAPDDSIMKFSSTKKLQKMKRKNCDLKAVNLNGSDQFAGASKLPIANAHARNGMAHEPSKRRKNIQRTNRKDKITQNLLFNFTKYIRFNLKCITIMSQL